MFKGGSDSISFNCINGVLWWFREGLENLVLFLLTILMGG